MFAAQARKYIGVVAVLALAATAVLAGAQDRTDRTALKKFAKEKAAVAKAEKREAARLARLLRIPLKKTMPDGSFAELMRFEGSMPVYYVTANLGAAQTVGASSVWPGGVTGLDLTGDGLTLHEWDAGSALLTHREIVGRAVTPDSASVDGHSAHVAGTMIATGIEATAKGMSFKANLRSFDWFDDHGEMADEAADGMLLSNHSYRSFYYGYSTPCIERDGIAYAAPYYLACQAGGNEGPSIRTLGSPSCAKNNLTVGAVTKHPAGYGGPGTVTIADFSSRGPTPDGRIKPDIVAPGVSLYSCSNEGDDLYSYKSGTSMATPCACGNLGLVTEYYQKTHSGTNMRSSTLRGLVIHTADEAGPADGPDYHHGWGQLNTNAACVVIKESLTRPEEIQEQTLASGNTFTYTVGCDGVQPIKVTLCWIDPPGPDIGDTATPALVNDLDLRVTNDGVEYTPWVLDNDNPENPATKGDNILDNVEQVVFQPVAGQCVITVTAKNALEPSGTQRFSLIVTGAVSPAMTGMSIDPNSLCSGDSATGTITLDLPAPSTGARVTLTNSNRTALSCPVVATVPAGLTTGTFQVTGKSVSALASSTVTATYNGQSFSDEVTVGPRWITGFSVTPSTIPGGNTAVGTVTLGKPAVAGGELVTISSSNTAAASVDWKVTIPEGETSATFNVQTYPVSNPALVTLSAAYPGPTAYTTITVTPTMSVSSLTLRPTSVRGGTSVKATVTLTMPAPTDLNVILGTNAPSAVNMPRTVRIKKGAKSATFSLRTRKTRTRIVSTVTASYGGASRSAQLTINP